MRKNDVLFIVLSLVLLTTLSLSLVSPVSALSEATLRVSWEDNDGPGGPGSTRAAELWMENITGMQTYGYQAFLNYDHSEMTFSHATYIYEGFELLLIDPIYEDEYGVLRMAQTTLNYARLTNETTYLVKLFFDISDSGEQENPYIWFDTEYSQHHHPGSFVPEFIGPGTPGEIPDHMWYIDSNGNRTEFMGYP